MMNREQLEKGIARLEHDIQVTIRAIDNANEDHDWYKAEEANQELVQLEDYLAEYHYKLSLLK